jgi:hypothetical protein
MYFIGLTLFSLHIIFNLQLMRKGVDIREKNLERERIERRQQKTMAGNRTNSQHLTNRDERSKKPAKSYLCICNKTCSYGHVKLASTRKMPCVRRDLHVKQRYL